MSTFEIQPIPTAAPGFAFRVTSGVEHAGEDATLQPTVVPPEQRPFSGEPATMSGAIVESVQEVSFVSAIARGFPEAPVAPEPAETILSPKSVPTNNEQRVYTEGFYGSVATTNKVVDEIEERQSGAAKACVEARVLIQEVMEVVASHIDLATVVRDEIVKDAAATARAYDKSVKTANLLAQKLADLEPEYRTAFNTKSVADGQYEVAKELTVRENHKLLALIRTKAKEIKEAKTILEEQKSRLQQIHEYLFANTRGDTEIELTPLEHLQYIVRDMDVTVDGWDKGNYTDSNYQIPRVHALLKEWHIPRSAQYLEYLQDESELLTSQQKAVCDEALKAQQQKQNAVREKEEEFAIIAQQKRQLEIARREALNQSADLHARIEEIANRSQRMVGFGQAEVVEILLHTLEQYKEQLKKDGKTDIDAIDIPDSPSHPIFKSVSDRPAETPLDTTLQLSSREGEVAVQGVLGAIKGAFRPRFEVVVDDTKQ